MARFEQRLAGTSDDKSGGIQLLNAQILQHGSGPCRATALRDLSGLAPCYLSRACGTVVARSLSTESSHVLAKGPGFNSQQVHVFALVSFCALNAL